MSEKRRVTDVEAHSPAIPHEYGGDPVYQEGGDGLKQAGYRWQTVDVPRQVEMLRLRGLGFPETLRYAASPSFNLRQRFDGV